MSKAIVIAFVAERMAASRSHATFGLIQTQAIVVQAAAGKRSVPPSTKKSTPH
jgi:hypothetical protein